jgi:hypothetical protein
LFSITITTTWEPRERGSAAARPSANGLPALAWPQPATSAARTAMTISLRDLASGVVAGF